MTNSLIEAKTISWLIEAGEPWTRYLVERDLISKVLDDRELSSKRQLILKEPAIVTLLSKALTWNGDTVLKRHNDAGHPLYAISTLADFGLTVEDPGIEEVVGQILIHQSEEGAFQSLANYPTTFGGSGKDEWLWAACDAPTLLYALKAISLAPEYQNHPVVEAGVEMLLKHWQFRAEKKYYLFGIGTDFKKLSTHMFGMTFYMLLRYSAGIALRTTIIGLKRCLLCFLTWQMKRVVTLPVLCTGVGKTGRLQTKKSPHPGSHFLLPGSKQGLDVDRGCLSRPFLVCAF